MATNIDRLFREKLDQVEMTPAADSWNQVKSQIGTKNTSWKIPLRIAAAVVVIVISTIVILNTEPSQRYISRVDHPAQHSTFIPNIPEESPTTRQKIAVEKVTLAKQPENTQIEESSELFETLNLTRLDVSVNFQDISPPKLIAPDFEADAPSVKITYIATETPGTSDTTKAITLKKVLALAKEITSADLLADIRDAKDNLFNRN